MAPKVELYEHQKEAIKDLSNGKVLCGGVGTGKSITALGYYYENERPKDIFIITTAKKRDGLDWEKEALFFGITKESRSKTLGKLHVDSWNNIKKYSGIKDAFFIFDEQRVVGTGTWAKHFIRIAKHNRWIMLSATPGDQWADYTAIFVANGFFKNQTEYKRQHFIYTYYAKYPRLEGYINEPKLERLRRMVLVEMEYVRHTTRHIRIEPVSYSKELVNRIRNERKNLETGEPFKGMSEVWAAMRKVVNADQSRIESLRNIIKQHRRVIVFYNFDYELDILRKGLKRYNVAEWNGHKHEEVPKDDAWVYLVQYTAGSEGWNCISTSTMVFYSLTYSYKQFEQAQGRIDRLNTPYFDLNYYVLKSTSPIDSVIWKALKGKQNFNEKAFFKNHAV